MRVIIPIGPQYSGKSTFCEKVVAAISGTAIISRDRILVELFGTVWLDSYSGGHHEGMHRLWKEVEAYVKEPQQTLILDTWNGHPEERKAIVEKLRILGASYVEGWHFVTPLKTCLEWSFIKVPFVEKPGNRWNKLSREIRVEQYSEIHKNFCQMQIAKEQIFDSVRQINALEPIPIEIFEAFSEKVTHG